MPQPRLLVSALLALFSCADADTYSPPSSASAANTETLLEWMTDLERPSRANDLRSRSAQRSSYDRRNRTPDDPENWFANYDRGNFEKSISRGGRTEWVMLDERGPGAFVRFWTANPQGTLRFYIDEMDEAAIQVDLEAIADGTAPFPFQPPFAYMSALGLNIYLPLAFASRMRVTTDAGVENESTGDADLFFHVGWLSLDGARVESASAETLERARPVLERVAEELVHPPRPMADDEWMERLDDGERVVVDAPMGGARIVELTLRPDRLDDASLRSTVLVMSFDGRETVRTPLGDFFGTAPGYNEYENLAFTVADGAMTCRFPMPFAERASIWLEGTNGAELEIGVRRGGVDPDPHVFHAGWRSTGIIDSGRQDVRLAAIEGEGTYLGNSFTITNPVDIWWGEGDEKVWVDDDEFPSFFGTGTEDYYGYAWAQDETFARPYHAQTRVDAIRGPEGGGVEAFIGHSSMNRLHVLDAIPFEERFVFDMEMWHWWFEVEVVVASTSWWYAPVNGDHDFPYVRAGETIVSHEELGRGPLFD
ncbi:MAG: hypothetical protein CMN30_14185 [Sandaracinus sp.]|nr:hypothetical protein [Sandaracinus sp.]